METDSERNEEPINSIYNFTSWLSQRSTIREKYRHGVGVCEKIIVRL